MRGLSGKVAIVPGGCTKIGRAVVDAFVAAGTQVMVADIAEGGGFAGGVAFQRCDLLVWEGVLVWGPHEARPGRVAPPDGAG